MSGSTLRMIEGDGQEGLAKLFNADAKMFGNRIFIFSYPTLRAEEDLCYLRIREANQDEYTNTDLPLRETFLLQFSDDAGQSWTKTQTIVMEGAKTNDHDGAMEPKLVEKKDGSVY